MKQSDYEKLSTPQRQKTSVAISGLDRSTPDDIVKDGACEELHNVRYKDNAWRPVHEHKVVAHPNLPISTADTSYNIVYKHPAAPESHYIAEIKVNGKYYYYDYDSAIAQWKDAITLIASFDEQQRVSHFGNIILFESSDSTIYYRYKNGIYSYYSAEAIYPYISSSIINDANATFKPKAFSVSENFTVSFDTPSAQNFSYTFRKGYWYEARSSIHEDFNIIDEVIKRAPETCTFRFMWEFARWDTLDSTRDTAEYSDLPSYQDERWNGEHAMFAVLRMKDGTFINPSPIAIGISQNKFGGCEIRKEQILYNTFRNTHYEADYFTGIIFVSRSYTLAENPIYTNLPDAPFNYVYEDITASVPNTINTDLIDSLAIFSTRIYPSIDLAKIRAIEETSLLTAISAYNDTSLPDQPFYLIAEKKIKECDNILGAYSFSIRLNKTEIDKIISGMVYEPLIQHSLIGNGSLDYNNRLHIYNLKQFLVDYPSINAIKDEGLPFTSQMGIHVQNSDIDAIKWGAVVAGLNVKDEQAHILSYPDYRAERFLVHVALGPPYTLALNTKQSIANNIAYYIPPATNDYKYPTIQFLESQGQLTDMTPSKDDVIYEPNRIQVSAPNNCFSFPFENSYAVGSSNNRIIALQSAAIEMSDAKFGEMPLYAFTTEGIYALQAGGETLYSNVIPINYDKIINPNTLAINGAIVYITEKGVHLLSNQGTQVISSPIHNSDGMPPLDFLRTCKIIHPKQYNEIVLLNETDKEGVAYVYNLDAGYWSTRDLEGFKLNTDELVLGNTIYDLADEDESKALPMTITTRPIKLGNIEFKRLETIAPRMSSGDKDFASHIHLTGSVNGTDYMTLREHEIEIEPHKVNPFTLRRTPFSAKYFKYNMFMEPKQGETFNPSITHIDYEWYIKFRRRMR